MPDRILKKTDAIWALEQKVAKSAEDILPQINLEALLADPRAYLEELAQEFLKEHLDEIEEGADVGAEFAEDVLTETKNREVK